MSDAFVMIAIECRACEALFMVRLGPAHDDIHCPMCGASCGSVPVRDDDEQDDHHDDDHPVGRARVHSGGRHANRR